MWNGLGLHARHPRREHGEEDDLKRHPDDDTIKAANLRPGASHV
jgi:hypothetical protein